MSAIKLLFKKYSLLMIVFFLSSCFDEHTKLPVIAIANYGPHASLFETIEGFKNRLKELGFQEGSHITFAYADAQFDPTLVIPMLSGLKAKHPVLCLAITTPVAQSAKTLFKDQNLVFSAITDPVSAGLLTEINTSEPFITGASEKQNIDALLDFMKALLPHTKRIGLLYATGEANDLALLQEMENKTKVHDLELIAQPIDHPRDVALRVQAFKNKIDVLYVGTSGPIQPSLPAIIAESNKLDIPIINADQDAVKRGQVLASFGVSYAHIGANAAELAAQILKGEKPSNLKPIHPQIEDHRGLINRKLADKRGIHFTPTPNIAFVE